ncbi:MAG: hypothetical protein AB7R89_06110 [Dehalococcoidia bacterium]
MVDEAQQQQDTDATRPEPPEGQSREQFTKAMLKAAYRGAGSTPINSREESVTGRCLSERFTMHLDVLQWVQEPYLTRRQVQIVELIYRDDLTIREVAGRLNVHHVTVSRDRHDALETIIRIAWNDPGYHLPYRVYTTSQSDAGWNEGP